MKRILAGLVLMVSLAAIAQTDVGVNTVDLTQRKLPKVKVTLTAQFRQKAVGVSLVNPDAVSLFTDANGLCVFSNVVSGPYKVTIAGNPGSTYPINVPTNSGYFEAAELRLDTNQVDTVLPVFYSSLDAAKAALRGEISAASNTVYSAARSNLVNCINVRDYGAVGDGVTDDTDAIAAAFAAFNAATNYLNLYFPRGRYRDTGTHYVTKASADSPYHSRGDRTIFGEGSLSLVQIEATIGAWVSTTNGMFNLRDMILYGPGPTVGAMSGIAMFGVESYPTIERVTVYNMSRYGMFFEGQRSVTINDTWLHQCWVGLGVGLGCDGLTYKGRLSGNSVGIEMGAMPYNVIDDSPVISGSRANGCRFDVVGGYNNDVLLLVDGGGTLQLTLSGRIEASRTVVMVGHQDRVVWTPATLVDSATLRTPAVSYSYPVLTSPVTLEGFYNEQGTMTNITAVIEAYRPINLVVRNSALIPSTGKQTLYLGAGAASSQINIQDSGLITLTNDTTSFIWQNNIRLSGTRDWLAANPLRLADASGLNPGLSVFQDASALYGSTLARSTNAGRWRIMTLAPNSADIGFGFYAAGALPTGNTNWFETLSIRGGDGGRVGIRTEVPSYTLDVGGDIRSTNVVYANGFFAGKVRANPNNVASQTALNPGVSVFEDANAIYGWHLGRNTGRSTWVLQATLPASGDFEIATHAAGTFPAAQTALTPRLHVNGANGFTGIGKSNPVAPLDVEGTALATLFGCPTNSAPANTTAIRAWINITNTTGGGVFKMPLYQ